MSISEEELNNCIGNVFWEKDEQDKRMKAKEEFMQEQAEKVGAKAEFKLIRDMSEAEFVVKSALMEQGEEANEIMF